MYLEFYGLRELPFELTANSRFLFLTAKQREALSILEYGLLSSKALTLLIGDAGTGKTTLIQAAMQSERCRQIRCVYLNNPMLSTADFVTFLARHFGLGREAEASKSILLEKLDLHLRESRAAGQVTALVVDEAQSLSTELLEEVRLLANIETATDKLLPIVLAGQPELADRLERPELRQLKQRVVLRCELEPFVLGDTAAYIARRISAAGGVPASLFTQEAVRLIHERSHGIPRVINVICDNALVGTMAMERTRVERAVVLEVCQDLKVGSAIEREPEPELPPILAPAAVEPGRAPSTEPATDADGLEQDEGALANRFNFRFRWRPSAARQSAKFTE